MAEYLVRLSEADIAFLVAGHMDVVPTLFELGLYKVEGSDTHFCCAVQGCAVDKNQAGTAEAMVNIGRFVLCRSHGIKIKRLAERLHAPRQFKFFKLVITLKNVAESESEGRVRQARAWLAEEPARLEAHKAAVVAARTPPRQPTPAPVPAPVPAPSPALPPALGAAAVASPAPVVAASVAPVPAPSAPEPTTDTGVEMAELHKQLEALKTLEDLLGPVQVELMEQAIKLKMAALNSAEIAKLRQQLAALEIVDGMLEPEAFAAAKLKILDRMAELGVTDSSTPTASAPSVPPPAAVPAPAPAPAAAAAPTPVAPPVPVAAPAPAAPAAMVRQRTTPGPSQALCTASRGTLTGNPDELAGKVGRFNPHGFNRVEDCFRALGQLKRDTFDIVRMHAESDVSDVELRNPRSDGAKAARKATAACPLHKKQFRALGDLRYAVLEFGQSIWPDRWEDRKDEESNGDGARHLKCAEHPDKERFGLLFDRATGAPRTEVGPDNVCGKCHKAHVNETEGPKREADRHARQAERGAASAAAKGAAGGGGGKGNKGGGGGKKKRG